MATRTCAAVDLRLTRAALFAAVCVALSAAGHLVASGHTVPVYALAAGWFAAFCLASLLAGRERSLPGIAAVLLGGQLALHLLFGLGQRLGEACAGTATSTGAGISAAVGTPAVSHLAGHHHAHLGHPVGAGTGAGTAGGLDAAASGSSAYLSLPGVLPMLLGHLAAALVAGWILSRGEAALWRLARLGTRAVEASSYGFPLRMALALVRALLSGLGGTRVPAGHPPDAPGPPRGGSLLLQHSVVRRGPPVCVLAA